jgi:phage-related protein
MPDRLYRSPARKKLHFLSGRIKSPPFSDAARNEAGKMLRFVQEGKPLSLPYSRPLPSVGPRCHELRVRDENVTWRILYRVDPDVVLVCAIFAKKSRSLPAHVVTACRQRFAAHDAKKGSGRT